MLQTDELNKDLINPIRRTSLVARSNMNSPVASKKNIHIRKFERSPRYDSLEKQNKELETKIQQLQLNLNQSGTSQMKAKLKHFTLDSKKHSKIIEEQESKIRKLETKLKES